MNAKISEIFQSIQGEGPYAGLRQVFIRFFECHMHCVWCDTPDSIGDGKREYKEYTSAALLKAVKPLSKGCHSVSLTGGEPLLQADFLKNFIPLLKPLNVKIYLETSGVLHKELKKIIHDVDIVSMDMKLPSSTQCRPFWKEHEEFLKVAAQKEVFVKIVVSAQTDKQDVRKAVGTIARTDPAIPLVIQPNTFDLKKGAVGKCYEYYDYCLKELRDVRILPQMHKFMNVR